MTISYFHIDSLATSLISKLNRRNIFPPLFDNPESFVSPLETRSKKPLNSFLICRHNVHKEANRNRNCNMRVISKAASMLWKTATNEEKSIYKMLAKRVKELHLSSKIMAAPPKELKEPEPKGPKGPEEPATFYYPFPVVDISYPTNTYVDLNNPINQIFFNNPNEQYYLLPTDDQYYLLPTDEQYYLLPSYDGGYGFDH
ncbi:hypothetical protein RclHR1_11790002 [Rhizophagus clarus]|uniref:HMG box domain-containing protein n=1 Tax=Rhizophagus clarus TaxID=94130 RepID=A0A2Z6QWZ1_9GLOM|nr:hypothetical protein RclHR1_11790002 [Rhizophagus clarus]GES83873.1 hypothetical protein GLOIN_2v1775985 [Rhizophagus clarus]